MCANKYTTYVYILRNDHQRKVLTSVGIPNLQVAQNLLVSGHCPSFIILNN
jgi:hypothetical protein